MNAEFPRCPAISPGVRKMPVPIVVPTITAIPNPTPRIRSRCPFTRAGEPAEPEVCIAHAKSVQVGEPANASPRSRPRQPTAYSAYAQLARPKQRRHFAEALKNSLISNTNVILSSQSKSISRRNHLEEPPGSLFRFLKMFSHNPEVVFDPSGPRSAIRIA